MTAPRGSGEQLSGADDYAANGRNQADGALHGLELDEHDRDVFPTTFISVRVWATLDGATKAEVCGCPAQPGECLQISAPVEGEEATTELEVLQVAGLLLRNLIQVTNIGETLLFTIYTHYGN